MKLFLMGASGMIGSRILAEALSRGHQVIAGARHPAGVAAGTGATAVAVDAADAAALARHAAAADVYVSAVSPRSTGDAVAETATYGAALMAAARRAGRRVILVGGAGSLDLPDGRPVLSVLPEAILPEATGMKRLCEALEASDLDWTFIAPAAQIAPGVRTGRFRLGGRVLLSDAAGESRISAEDYAAALLDEAETPAHRRQVMTVAY